MLYFPESLSTVYTQVLKYLPGEIQAFVDKVLD